MNVVRLLFLSFPIALMTFILTMFGVVLGTHYLFGDKFVLLTTPMDCLAAFVSITAGSVVARSNNIVPTAYILSAVPLLAVFRDYRHGLAEGSQHLPFIQEVIGIVIGIALAWYWMKKRSRKLSKSI